MAIIHALPKGDGQVRPVANGTRIIKLAMQAIMSRYKHTVEEAAGVRQFGLEQGGAESAMRAFVTLEAIQHEHLVIATGCTNAFGNPIRERMLHTITREMPT